MEISEAIVTKRGKVRRLVDLTSPDRPREMICECYEDQGISDEQITIEGMQILQSDDDLEKKEKNEQPQPQPQSIEMACEVIAQENEEHGKEVMSGKLMNVVVEEVSEKRKRGRPRKERPVETEEAAVVVKRKRGRPRKARSDQQGLNVILLSPVEERGNDCYDCDKNAKVDTMEKKEENNHLDNTTLFTLNSEEQSLAVFNPSTLSCSEEKEELDEVLLELCHLQDELRQHLHQSHQFALSIAEKVCNFLLCYSFL